MRATLLFKSASRGKAISKISPNRMQNGESGPEGLWRDADREDDQDLGPGDVVWVVTEDYPPWPAQVRINEDKGTFLNRKGSKVWVSYIGEDEQNWVRLDQVYPFTKATLNDFLDEARQSPDYDKIEDAAGVAYKMLKKQLRDKKLASKKPKSKRKEEPTPPFDSDAEYEDASSVDSAGSPTSVTNDAPPARKPRKSETSRKNRSAAKKSQVNSKAITQASETQANNRMTESIFDTEDAGNRFSDRDEARLMTLTHLLASKKRDFESDLSRVVDQLHTTLCSLEEKKTSVRGESDMFLAQAQLVRKMYKDRAARLNDEATLQTINGYLAEFDTLMTKTSHAIFDNEFSEIDAAEWSAKEQAVHETETLRGGFKDEVSPLKNEYRSLRARFQDFADFDFSTESVPTPSPAIDAALKLKKV